MQRVLYSFRSRSTSAIPARAKIPIGRTIVLRDASTAASSQRCFRAARNDPNTRARNKGSAPPRRDRSIHSRLAIAKKPATHPPHKRYAIATAANDPATEMNNKDAQKELWLSVENATMAYGKPQNCQACREVKSQ